MEVVKFEYIGICNYFNFRGAVIQFVGVFDTREEATIKCKERLNYMSEKDVHFSDGNFRIFQNYIENKFPFLSVIYYSCPSDAFVYVHFVGVFEDIKTTYKKIKFEIEDKKHQLLFDVKKYMRGFLNPYNDVNDFTMEHIEEIYDINFKIFEINRPNAQELT